MYAEPKKESSFNPPVTQAAKAAKNNYSAADEEMSWKEIDTILANPTPGFMDRLVFSPERSPNTPLNGVQPKLKIGLPENRYQPKADQISDRGVTSSTQPAIEQPIHQERDGEVAQTQTIQPRKTSEERKSQNQQANESIENILTSEKTLEQQPEIETTEEAMLLHVKQGIEAANVATAKSGIHYAYDYFFKVRIYRYLSLDIPQERNPKVYLRLLATYPDYKILEEYNNTWK